MSAELRSPPGSAELALLCGVLYLHLSLYYTLSPFFQSLHGLSWIHSIPHTSIFSCNWVPISWDRENLITLLNPPHKFPQHSPQEPLFLQPWFPRSPEHPKPEALKSCSPLTTVYLCILTQGPMTLPTLTTSSLLINNPASTVLPLLQVIPHPGSHLTLETSSMVA